MVKQILFVVCGILFFINDVYSQDQKVVDSLKLVLKNKSGGERFLPLYQLAVEYVDKDNKKALNIIQQAEEAALLSGDSLWIVKSKRVKGQILLRLEKIEESIHSNESVLNIAQRNKFTREYTKIINNLASSYSYYCQYDKALLYYFETLELGRQLQDSAFIATGLHNIGIVYYKLRDYDKALIYLTRSLTISKSMNDVKYYTLMNISLCYAHLKDFLNAQFYVKESLSLCGRNCTDGSMMHIKYTMGFIFLGLKQYDEAEIEFLSSYSYAKKSNYARMQFDNIYHLTEIYLRRNRIAKARYYLGEAEKLISQGAPFNLERLKIYSRLYEVYSLLGNFKKVAHYQAKYIHLKDSLYNEALTTNLMEIESDFHQRENRQKIAQQNEVLILKEAIINRQWILNIVIGMLGSITSCFLVLLFRNYKQKKDLNVMLNKKVENRTRELELSRDELLKAFQERNTLINRASEDITETINTIKGLCFIGRKDVSDPVVCSYMDNIEKTSHHLGRHLNSLFKEKIVVSSF